ncbi:MAG: SWIM zinc finger family protein [Nanoarchaeota archaeon]|nr:SWIM zinc finger family protein [Nanoarchaeota archaeon]
MKSLKDIKVEDLHTIFSSTILQRGEEYFEEGNVQSIELLSPSEITSVVQGSEDYNVSVSIGNAGDVECECSCPCDFNCKHAAALLLKWVSTKKRYFKELESVKAAPKETISQLLSKKTKEEIITILENAIGKHPELKALVKIERKEITLKIRALFSHFWEWDEIKDLISKLETILEGIKNNKSMWDKSLLDEMEASAKTMINGVNNVHDEGDVGIFLEDWFEAYGKIFAETKPSKKEKAEFVNKIISFIKSDEYGLDSSYESAFKGMCASEEDITLIREMLGHVKHDTDEEEYYTDMCNDLYLNLYDKLGMDDKYVRFAQKTGMEGAAIDRLITLDRMDEALEICERTRKKSFSPEIEDKRLVILKRLGKKEELKESLLNMLKKTADLNYFLKLKEESPKEEWKNYLKEILSHAKSKKQNAIVSRICYYEDDLKNAYEYSKGMTDTDYLELLAKKLGSTHPKLACELYKKLCTAWINAGSGWPYKKAGKMLEAIKKLDRNGSFFHKTKEEIIKEHKKKYSLMQIIIRI